MGAWYTLKVKYLDHLNTEQKKAVLETEGPVLIVAGAGAGKTKTLTHRILHLIVSGIEPENILAITFTNKAAKEMRERILSLLNQAPEMGLGAQRIPFISTFHALGVRIIKENAEILKLKRHFKIFDKQDSKKALKEALNILGLDPKEHLDKVGHIISKEKGRGVSVKDYMENGTYDFTSEIVKKSWEKYEEVLRKEYALDFDDLLLITLKLLEKNRDILERYQKYFLYIHVDEYQDTNKVQNKIVNLLAERHKNICVVGDGDQCLIKDTKVKMADGSLKKMEKIKTGDMVLSNYGGSDFRGAKITNVIKKPYKGDLIKIETKKGNSLISTPEHIHFAGYRLGTTPQIFLNYLMYKNNIGWRIGTTSIYTNEQKKSVPEYIQRSNQEHADSVWIVGTHANEMDSRVNEYLLSLKYQIPTIPFTPRLNSKGKKGGYVHDITSIKKIFSNLDTEKSAIKLLSDLGLSKTSPHHRSRSKNSNRRNINIVLCADRRGKNPMHLISIHGNDLVGKNKLKSLGLSVRKSKSNKKNWRFETVRASYGEACLLATKISSAFPDAILVFSARLGGIKNNPKDGNSLPLMEAGSVKPGMTLFLENGYDIIDKVSHIASKGTDVFDINVERTHNFIANNIITHNCIYSWRGAEIKNMLHFEKTYPEVKTFFLEQNYRSTKNILSVANEIIEKNNFRIPKKLYTEKTAGEKVGIFEARDERDEAFFIALKCKKYIEEGLQTENIAVLYRANFQSRVLEEAFLSCGVPYQMIGTKFFERKEVKDLISFIRASQEPEIISDFSSDFFRIINIPPRGIGKITLEKIIRGRDADLPGSAKAKLENFRLQLKLFKDVLEKEKLSTALKFIIKNSGMEKMYETGLSEDEERLENLMELVTLASTYDELPKEEALEKFLTDVALVSDQDSLADNKSGVRLMTVHSSKGLEFDYVFIAGLENDLFPHKRMSEHRKSGEEAEEERRLFYVAVTRAGKKLILTHAVTRTIFGSLEVNSPSEFIDDISKKYLEEEGYNNEKVINY